MDALYQLAGAGVRVPEPYGYFNGVLVMEMITDAEGFSAPGLGDVELTPEQAREYHAFLIGQIVRMLCAGLIHGDLSEYNVLVGPEGPVIIDLPQVVSAAGNNNARMMLIRDVNNISATLGRFAPELLGHPLRRGDVGAVRAGPAAAGDAAHRRVRQRRDRRRRGRHAARHRGCAGGSDPPGTGARGGRTVMKIELTPHEARVIGCLLEKEVTTPEQYPLSINALTNACNQKSNRDPVLNLTESAVQQIVDGLMKKHLVSDRSGYGGRVTKYKQTFCNSEFGLLKFTDLERAILCELLVRGPQSAGELRTRCNRMASVADVAEVEVALRSLAEHASGPFVTRLPRLPGTRDARYGQLLTGEIAVAGDIESPPEHLPPGNRGASLADRVRALEDEVAALKQALAEIREHRA